MKELFEKLYSMMCSENLGTKYVEEFKGLSIIHELNGIESNKMTKEKELNEYFTNLDKKEEEK